jgi:hypothetical protein
MQSAPSIGDLQPGSLLHQQQPISNRPIHLNISLTLLLTPLLLHTTAASSSRSSSAMWASKP